MPTLDNVFYEQNWLYEGGITMMLRLNYLRLILIICANSFTADTYVGAPPAHPLFIYLIQPIFQTLYCYSGQVCNEKKKRFTSLIFSTSMLVGTISYFLLSSVPYLPT